VFTLASRVGAEPLWAYRYRMGGRVSRRVQRGGFASEADARAALGRALEGLRCESGIGRTLTLAEFVDEYLAQHDASPVTLKKLRFLLTRAVQAFGDYPWGALIRSSCKSSGFGPRCVCGPHGAVTVVAVGHRADVYRRR
jgi:hypothetical protein